MEMRLMEREASATHVAVAPPSPPPPPSSTTSPSHEFSFTISLHPNFSTSNPPLKCNKPPHAQPSAFDIDLAPADDIFLHGHLLPLHLLSRPSISPRASDISIEDLTLPLNANDAPATTSATHQAKERNKPKTKSLSSFFGFKKEKLVDSDDKKSTKKGLEIARMLKNYASMVLFFMGKKEKDVDLRKRHYSFSGNLSNPRGWRPSRRSSGGFSMPASKRTSPTNSGLLLAVPTTASSDGSTMEELQNAIQAAIAHCKSSTGGQRMLIDKCKF